MFSLSLQEYAEAFVRALLARSVITPDALRTMVEAIDTMGAQQVSPPPKHTPSTLLSQ